MMRVGGESLAEVIHAKNGWPTEYTEHTEFNHRLPRWSRIRNQDSENLERFESALI